ncbi:MAG: twin-arginine translocase subunit TatB [Arcobacter sp.]|nr:MAG: twin-arginine translocase subunit TatB [Arcobacter sp.]
MFGMGFMEIMIIAVIAVIFLGPDKLPEAMINIAKFFRSMKSTVADAKQSLEQEMSISELKQEALSYKEELMSASHELDRVTSMANLDDNFDDVKETIASIDKVKTPSMYAEAKHDPDQVRVLPEQETNEKTVTFEKKKKKKKVTKPENTEDKPKKAAKKTESEDN